MRKLKIALLSVAALIVVGAAVSYGLATRGERPLTSEIRKGLPGNYVTIGAGTVRYDWHGPERGPVVVLVHGFSTPSYVFQRNVPALAAAGFRVLTFDHLGRGYSDRPSGAYDADFFDKELTDLLAVTNVKGPVSILGYSLGGGIVTVFAARHPDRVKKLVLVAPVGFMPKPTGSKRLLHVPLLGEWLFAVIGRSSMIDGFEKERVQGIATEEMVRLYAEQFTFQGYRQALLATVRNFPFGSLQSEYEAIGRARTPTLVLWGSADTEVPTIGSESVKAAIPSAQMVILNGATHSLVYSHQDTVNAALIGFLNK